MDEDDAVLDDTIAIPVGSWALGDNRGDVFHLVFSLQLILHPFPSLPFAGLHFGWLYSHVAASTIVDPKRKVKDIWKSNNATDTRNEITILRLVAKPLRILSEYLMTMAVTKPPKTWIATVAHAQPPKLSNIPTIPASDTCEKMTGKRAGSKENADS